ncbi:ISLre2 family transposase [Aquibacillus salsiterrae]|uniref:ISLre2 family transposase n=1 Tax=Aquibacillus salsiterrae TaxID=2950439 RepID=A0A9X3WJ16_9BACI|nr:ISLre2 family transposase [Aquibacillus salsiterrae]MDC3418334.1 ISLre2 family transposase [Aquibacillus salsiterrae]
MEKIISKLYQIINSTNSLIDLEENVKMYMHDVFSSLLGDVFTQLDQVIKEQKQAEGWTVIRDDDKTVQFTFGGVTFRHTSMRDKSGDCRHPFDEWLGLRKHQRHSALVEVKVAEMASETDYRETARVLKEWTAVNISHTTVGSIVKRVGKAQAEADKEMVVELDEADFLPEGKKVDFLYAEADGVFVRGTKRKNSLEVRHAVVHEGWDKSGKRVSLRKPKVIMTTQPTVEFWKEVQAFTAHQYSLEDTQIVSNSDGGAGYTAEKFQEAFSQSKYPVLNQLDLYHVSQALNRAFGGGSNEFKAGVKKALKEHNKADFKLWMDTYESILEEEKGKEKLEVFRKYIEHNWERIFDWREKVENPPEDARSLGAMESNQRHVSFRMKKRGMHWSKDGGEGMVKIIQGILNGTLRDVYLKHQKRSERKQRQVKQTVRMAQILRQPTRPTIGARQGSISLYVAHSSARGQLLKSFR